MFINEDYLGPTADNTETHHTQTNINNALTEIIEITSIMEIIQWIAGAHIKIIITKASGI